MQAQALRAAVPPPGQPRPIDTLGQLSAAAAYPAAAYLTDGLRPSRAAPAAPAPAPSAAASTPATGEEDQGGPSSSGAAPAYQYQYGTNPYFSAAAASPAAFLPPQAAAAAASEPVALSSISFGVSASFPGGGGVAEKDIRPPHDSWLGTAAEGAAATDYSDEPSPSGASSGAGVSSSWGAVEEASFLGVGDSLELLQSLGASPAPPEQGEGPSPPPPAAGGAYGSGGDGGGYAGYSAFGAEAAAGGFAFSEGAEREREALLAEGRVDLRWLEDIEKDLKELLSDSETEPEAEDGVGVGAAAPGAQRDWGAAPQPDAAEAAERAASGAAAGPAPPPAPVPLPPPPQPQPQRAQAQQSADLSADTDVFLRAAEVSIAEQQEAWLRSLRLQVRVAEAKSLPCPNA